jgi:hypothetical protein
MLSIHDLLHGEPDDPTSQIFGDDESNSSQESHRSSSHNQMGLTEPLHLFNRSPNNDINMADQTSNGGIEQICAALQSKMNLDPDHLKIALLASKASLSCNSSASLQLFMTSSSPR